MSPLWGHFVGVITVVLMLVFIGIWIWAWRPRHAAAFSRLAEIPMRDGPASSFHEDATHEDATP
jgi:cytochrome c oxidase cbb3-type subunit IV